MEEYPSSDLEHGQIVPDTVDGDDDSDETDAFDIVTTKHASIERLRRWREATLVLNGHRRFRYTTNLKREAEKKEMFRQIRTSAQVIPAAELSAVLSLHTPYTSLLSVDNDEEDVYKKNTFRGRGNQELSDCLYGIEKETLLAISREANFSALQMLGGINGLAEKLKTNLEKGILHIDDDDLFQRKSTFGSNSYPVKKGLSFLRLLWEACQDQALLTLIVAAVALLAFGVKSEGIKEGWYTGGSILFAVTTVIIVIAISDYIQYLQFQKVDKEKRDIHTKVVRGGRSKKISIDDVVVGDVVPLKIGDQPGLL